MATGIRFPPSLSVPDRDGYGDTFEEIRSAFEPEVGAVRRRNRMRVAPRLFDLQWTFDQTDFHTFDVWWQDTIKGGERLFDVQLLDDDETIVWFTVRALGVYKAEIVNEMEWRVTMRVRALGENFGSDRPAGTDELSGEITVGVSLAIGYLKIAKALRGLTTVGVTPVARLNFPALHGLTTVGMYRLPRGTLTPIPLLGVATVGVESAPGELVIVTFVSYPEDSRQWQDLDWFGTFYSEDISASAAAVSREWMEI